MEKILIVEDDPMLIEIYQKKFLNDGFGVVTAMTGVEVLKKIKEEKPGLVLLDLVLPEEDGFEVLKKIKENPQLKDTRVIIFSNLSQAEDKQKAIDFGADGFITKSDYTPKEIIEEVKKVISEKRLSEKGSVNFLQKKTSGSLKETNNNKILLIDNKKVFAEVFGEKLKESGFDVDVVRTDAWKEYWDKKYDLLIVDFATFGDWKKLEEFKNQRGSSDLKIVVLKNGEEMDSGEMKFVDKFLNKTGITPTGFLKEIETIINN